MVQFLILLCLLAVCSEADKVTVVTSKGSIVGNKNDGYNTFFGVPYAQVNPAHPFGARIDYPNFETPFAATNPSVMCPQVYFSDGGVLDCLHLNIYVPQRVSKQHKLPILVWFHGGGFAFGSAGEYGGQYLVKKKIIVITANYRQGAYGFLCLNDPSVVGNHGMKDQIAALRWIKEHIANFGGDPQKVTIAGESYGGGGVDLHLYSKYETLFDKAIIQSGSIYVTEGIFVNPDHKAAMKIAKRLGHPVTTTREALQVLAKANPVAVNAATRNLSMILTLCKEEKFRGIPNFVTEDPFHLKNPERIRNTKIMIGYTSQEMLYEFANKDQSFYDKSSNPFTEQLNKTFFFPNDKLQELSRTIQHFYLGGRPIGPDVQLELSNFLSDFAINYPVEWSLNRFIEQGASGVYKYLFSYTGGSDYQNITGSGASHTEELKYLFDWIWAKPLTTREQLMMRERMTTMWANFVKYGDPTPKLSTILPVKWNPVKDDTKPYMDIDVEMTMKEHVFRHRMAFWDLFWKCYLKNHLLLN